MPAQITQGTDPRQRIGVRFAHTAAACSVGRAARAARIVCSVRRTVVQNLFDAEPLGARLAPRLLLRAVHAKASKRTEATNSRERVRVGRTLLGPQIAWPAPPSSRPPPTACSSRIAPPSAPGNALVRPFPARRARRPRWLRRGSRSHLVEGLLVCRRHSLLALLAASTAALSLPLFALALCAARTAPAVSRLDIVRHLTKAETGGHETHSWAAGCTGSRTAPPSSA